MLCHSDRLTDALALFYIFVLRCHASPCWLKAKRFAARGEVRHSKVQMAAFHPDFRFNGSATHLDTSTVTIRTAFYA